MEVMVLGRNMMIVPNCVVEENKNGLENVTNLHLLMVEKIVLEQMPKSANVIHTNVKV